MVFLPARAGRPALLRRFFNQFPGQFALLPEDMSN
jgi:hypothetical protein